MDIYYGYYTDKHLTEPPDGDYVAYKYLINAEGEYDAITKLYRNLANNSEYFAKNYSINDIHVVNISNEWFRDSDVIIY